MRSAHLRILGSIVAVGLLSYACGTEPGSDAPASGGDGGRGPQGSSGSGPVQDTCVDSDGCESDDYCSAGVCVPDCAPGSTLCADGALATCRLDGAGFETTECAYGCISNVGVAHCAEEPEGIGGMGAAGGAGEPGRCDSEGNCYCLSVLVLGAADSASANATGFADWLNEASNAKVTIMDPSDAQSPTPKPTLTEQFLADYDVIILQLQGDSKSGPFWTYADDEVTALEAWVEEGNGLISLTGYNGNVAAAEAAASNQLIDPIAGLSYGTTDIASTTPFNAYCWGHSYPVNQWLDTPGFPISYQVDAVGAFHGYPVSGGASIANAGGTAIGAIEEVGDGYVFAWGDEFVLFESTWNAEDPSATQYTDSSNPCYNKRPEDVLQPRQFWFNALSYVSQGEGCALEVDDDAVILR